MSDINKATKEFVNEISTATEMVKYVTENAEKTNLPETEEDERRNQHHYNQVRKMSHHGDYITKGERV